MKILFVLILLLSSPLGNAQVPDSVRTYHWGELPAEFDADTIISLSFYKMKLDSLPDSLEFFENLQYLNLGKNRLTELPNYFSKFISLKILNFEKNRFDVFPLVICQLESLERLIVNRNFISRIPDCIEYAESLEYIDFYDNPISYVPESFERLHNLKKVDFSGVKFGPSFQRKWITRMPDVEFVFEAPCDCME